MPADKITIPRPDAWHLHLRDGDMLAAVLRASARDFGRAIVMPNLKPPVTTAAAADAYRTRIRALLPADSGFEPLMSCYLTDNTSADDLRAGKRDGVFIAAKLYPAGATTNADAGVTSLARLHRVFETMQDIGLPLLIHGEVTDPAVDVFDREAVFIDTLLVPLRRDFPALKLVLEHVTTREGVQFVVAHAVGRFTHRFTSCRGGGRADRTPSSISSRIRSRARCSRDMTVPTGTSRMTAASA